MRNKLIIVAVLVYMVCSSIIAHAQSVGDPPVIIDPMPPLYIEYYLPYIAK
jgi:hypothetical protein